MNQLEAEQRKLALLTAADRLAVSSSPDWRAFLEALEGFANVEFYRLLACENTDIIHHRQGYALALATLTADLQNARELGLEAKRRIDAMQQRSKR